MTKAKSNTKAAPKADPKAVETKVPGAEVEVVVDGAAPLVTGAPTTDLPAGAEGAGTGVEGAGVDPDAPAGDNKAPAAEEKAPKKREIAEGIFNRELPKLNVQNPTPWRTAVIRMIMAEFPGMSLNNASTLYNYAKKAAVKENKIPDFGRSPAKAVLEKLQAPAVDGAPAVEGAPVVDGAPVVEGAGPEVPAGEAKEPEAPAVDAKEPEVPAGEAKEPEVAQTEVPADTETQA